MSCCVSPHRRYGRMVGKGTILNATPRNVLFAACLLAAAPAHASDKADFAACDGLEQPGKQDDGMRGAANVLP